MMYGSKTFLELSVGKTHIVETIINIRRSDLSWWNDEDGLKNRENDLFKLIERRILPQEFGNEIEDYHDEKKRRYDGCNVKKRGQKRGYDHAIIGEKNLIQMKKSRNNKADKRQQRSQRSGVSTNSFGQKDKNKKNIKTIKGKSNSSQERKYTSSLDVTFLFGEEIQVTYKVEEISTSNSVTLLYRPSSNNPVINNEPNNENSMNTRSAKKSGGKSTLSKTKHNQITQLCNFLHLPKLSKRIILWVYAYDPSNPSDPNPTGGGFPRPEMIPISSLFSEPEG